MQIVINNIKMPVNHKIEDVLLAAQEFVRQQCIYADNFIYTVNQLTPGTKINKIYLLGGSGSK